MQHTFRVDKLLGYQAKPTVAGSLGEQVHALLAHGGDIGEALVNGLVC